MFVKIISHPECARLAAKVRPFCASDPMWLIPADPPTSYGHDLVSSGAKGIPKSSVRKEPRPFIAVLGSIWVDCEVGQVTLVDVLKQMGFLPLVQPFLQIQGLHYLTSLISSACGGTRRGDVM